jgi:hypothetical protein
MKLKVRKSEFERAGLKERVYFVKVVEAPDMLVIVDKSDIPVRFYSENGKLYADVPDDIVKELKHDRGEELEILPLDDMKRKYVALIIL